MTPRTDLAPADWLRTSRLPWDRLVTFGPEGFAAYARLRFLPDPASPGQQEADAEPWPGTETELLRTLLGVLARHTSTPEHCYYALWDGWGFTVPGPSADAPHERPQTYTAARPGLAPHRVPAASALDGPLLELPHRSYALFEGEVGDLGDWGEVQRRPGWPGYAPVPAFVWPADRAWCVARDVDPHWAGIGASEQAVDELVRHPGLDVVASDPAEEPPAYR
ncbi:hypothetical protein CLV35_1857 [Motilibacter peucedani]|uniref:Uncharacterized protein n=1 Tax=Motilibacter peucedani TaxID=598650 RepID=A0A420XQ73_9ACTN|nr:hypothetical protein [Motilibacter peucedani]RKS75394.1 hypothetical protein CLV35_1857 [Motilibacter peucedani]